MSKERLKEIEERTRITLSVHDYPDVDILHHDYAWLIEQAKQIEHLKSDKETLMMAHDSLNRELSHYRKSFEKDKHELIKANISKIKRIEDLEEQNKRYREAIGHMTHIILHPFSKTLNKYETLHKIETILKHIGE